MTGEPLVAIGGITLVSAAEVLGRARMRWIGDEAI